MLISGSSAGRPENTRPPVRPEFGADYTGRPRDCNGATGAV